MLVGSALTAGSDRVVAAGRAVARALGARLRLLHAEPRPADLIGGHSLADATWEKQREEAELALAEQVQRLGIAPGEIAGTSCEEGVPHRVLVAAARRGGADLVVVGAHEGGGLSGIFGSTASRVLRHSTRPVLVVRSPSHEPPRRILLPVDLSPLSADAFRAGLDLVRAWTGDEIEAEALFVLSELDVRGRDGDGDEARQAAVSALFRFVAAHRGDFPRDVAQRVVEGEPRAEILHRIGVSKPDLVVLGTHGRGGFELLLVGSVAEGVVREAGCNSLVIPPDAALRAALAREAATREGGAG